MSTQPEAAFLREETLTLLRDAILKLDEKERTVLSLHYVEKLKMEQIGQVMGISQPRASQIHTGALRKLRRILK